MTAKAILWAQWRILRRGLGGGRLRSAMLSSLLAAVWYGAWAGGAVMAGLYMADPAHTETIPRYLPVVLMLVFFYWQLAPVLASTTGVSLDTRKLRAYPVPHGQLFFLEVMLRIPVSAEAVLVLTGAAAGLLANPAGNYGAAPVGLALFALANLFFSAGLKNLIDWVLEKKLFKELFFLIFIIVVATPQFLLRHVTDGNWEQTLAMASLLYLPWSCAAAIASGEAGWLAWGLAIGWTAAAYLFGRRQFERGIRRERASVELKVEKGGPLGRLVELFYRLPTVLLPDPLAGLAEKELRALTRSPRFRLVFFMGFSFGLLLWMPLTFGEAGADSTMARNFLTFVSVYALLLLGEVAFWNSFGFDRTAAQFYFLAPIRLSQVMMAKNLAVLLFVIFEVLIVAAVCFALGLPIAPAHVPEAILVTLTFSLFLLAAGNLSSIHYPKNVDPEQSWGSASPGRFQALLLLLYPVLAFPVLLAYLARYAFSSELAFYGVLALAAGIGSVFYWVALDSVLAVLEERKEKFLTQLATSAGPIGAR